MRKERPISIDESEVNRHLQLSHPSYIRQLRSDISEGLYIMGLSALLVLGGTGIHHLASNQIESQIEAQCQLKGVPDCQKNAPGLYQQVSDSYDDIRLFSRGVLLLVGVGGVGMLSGVTGTIATISRDRYRRKIEKAPSVSYLEFPKFEPFERYRKEANSNRRLTPVHPLYKRQLRRDLITAGVVTGIGLAAVGTAGYSAAQVEKHIQERVDFSCHMIGCSDQMRAYPSQFTVVGDVDAYLARFPKPTSSEVRKRDEEVNRVDDWKPVAVELGVGMPALALGLLSLRNTIRRHRVKK